MRSFHFCHLVASALHALKRQRNDPRMSVVFSYSVFLFLNRQIEDNENEPDVSFFPSLVHLPSFNALIRLTDSINIFAFHQNFFSSPPPGCDVAITKWFILNHLFYVLFLIFLLKFFSFCSLVCANEMYFFFALGILLVCHITSSFLIRVN